jgi:hypothetical protein
MHDANLGDKRSECSRYRCVNRVAALLEHRHPGGNSFRIAGSNHAMGHLFLNFILFRQHLCSLPK